MPDATNRRADLCLRIAQQIGKQFYLRHTEFDEDVCADIINACLPLTYSEAEEAYAAADEAETPMSTAPPKLSCMTRLREAMDLGKEVSLMQVVEAAIERIEWMKGLKT